MMMAKRWIRDAQDDPTRLVIDLDSEEIERGKAQRLYRLNVIQIPTLRVLGFCLLALCLLLHNFFLLKSFSWTIFFEIVSIVISYSLASWLVLYFLFEKIQKFDIGFLFLVIDVFIWTAMIYFSGGEKSLLFWLMVMRVADQINTSFKRALFFGHLSTASYIAMLLYLMYVDHQPISLLQELPKIVVIYASNLYFAMAARTSEQHRNRTAAAVRVARDLILQLNQKSRQLEASKANVEQLSRQNELILRSAGEGIYGLDLQGHATFVNPVVAKMTGYTIEELLGQPTHALLYHSKADATPHLWEACPVLATLTTGAGYQHGESVLWRKDGTHFPVQYISTPIREAGAIVGAVVTFNDITERKRAEEALRLSRERYALAVNAGKVGVWDWDIGSGHVYLDPILKALLGFEESEIPNEIGAWSSHVHPDDRERVMAAARDHLDGKTPHYEIEHRMVHKYGSIRWFLARGTALRDAHGKPYRMVGTDSDITERKEVEVALQRVKEELELKVEERTIELKRANEQLLTDIVMRRRAEAALAAEARFLRAQTEVAKVALSSLRPEELAQPLIETIGRAQGYAYGALWRVGGDAKSVTLVAAFGEGTAPFVGVSQALCEPSSFTALIIRTGQPTFRNRIWESPYGRNPITHSLNARALLGLPLIDRTGRVVGAITFADTEDPERFTERDLIQGTVLVNQVAQAIENSELFSQVNQLQEQYRVVTEALNDAVFTLDAEARFAFGNAAGERLTGYRLEELLGQSFMDLVAPEDLPELVDRFRRAIAGEAISPHVQAEMIRKDGSRVPIELSMANLVLDGRIVGRVGVARDVTDRRHAEEQIKASLQEKEVLLKEIHHRVKNNLQIISSLLNLQSKHINDPKALQMFIDSQNRVKSIALIHEILFRSRDIAKIDFAEYIKNISVQIFRLYGAYSRKITLEVNVKNIMLDVDTAIPCGLIVTELVSNSLKYAFSDGKEGSIYIEFSSDSTGTLTLIVSDNGIGFPKHVDFQNMYSLGLKLVVALANQLAGTVELDSSCGTTFKIMFADDKRKERKDEHDAPSDHGC
ncbi:MAG: PAS domain S-box protein [Candidatus Entotheonellia bacterium]